MSVVKDFHQLKKYNIQELTMAPSDEQGIPSPQVASKEDTHAKDDI